MPGRADSRLSGTAPVGLVRGARTFSERWGTLGVFFTRWLVSPLGPAVNLLSGLIGMPWRWFSVAGVLGEVVWVGMYVALGYVFSRSIIEIADILGSLTWLLASAVVTVVLVWRARSILRARAARIAATL